MADDGLGLVDGEFAAGVPAHGVEFDDVHEKRGSAWNKAPLVAYTGFARGK
ncbi:MAG: hypothetical protein WB760_32775 [Xanthobacteraceae bacterium]